MNTSNNTDRKGLAYAITTIIVLCFTVLPFSGDIYKDITTNSQLAHTLEVRNALFDMSQADTETHHVNDFTLLEMPNGTHDIWLGSTFVETDFDEQTAAELFYTKEEIVVRVDGHRVSIIAGDNGQF